MGRRDVRFSVGFTLIELLVVVAIISLLVSILLPSLQTAKDLAKSVVCQSNLKQILTGSSFYSEDYGGYIEPSFSPADRQDTYIYSWAGLLRTYLGASESSTLSSVSELPVASCPESPLRFGYGQNIYLGMHDAASNTVRFYRMDEIEDPNSTVHFIDNIDTRASAIDPSAFIRWKSWVRPAGSNVTDIVPYFVHAGKKANVGWVDSHVDSHEEESFYDPYDVEYLKAYWDRAPGLYW